MAMSGMFEKRRLTFWESQEMVGAVSFKLGPLVEGMDYYWQGNSCIAVDQHSSS
jgi:hypothetical protein